MPKRTKTIDSALVDRARASLKGLGEIGRVSNRLQCIISAYKYNIKHVAEVFEVSRVTVHSWVNRFQRDGVEGLANLRKPSRAKLSSGQKAVVKQWVEALPTMTLKELVFKVEKKLGLTISKSSIHRVLVELGFAHITGRKKHYQSDKLAQEEFKKNFEI